MGLTVVVGALSLTLPPEGFFAGDPGVKLVAAQAAVAHPDRPFNIELPEINGRPAPEFLYPFYTQHADHAHAVTAPLFPLATAPLLWLFGIRGAYILPIVSFGVVLVATHLLARQLDAGTPNLAVLSMAFCSPVVFFALEYWDHVPAVAATSSALLFLIMSPRPRTAFASGVLLAVATQLRPEAFWFAAAALVVTAPTASHCRIAAAASLGFAAGMAPITVFNLIHFGDVAGLHISSNLRGLGSEWLPSRLALVQSWLGPADSSLALVGLFSMIVALAAPTHATTTLAASIGLAFLSFAALGRTLPRENLWGAAPFLGTALLAVGRMEPGTRRTIAWLAFLTVIGVLLTAPNDGGAQWGPRYLLVATTPLVVLGASNARQAWTHAGIHKWVTRLALLFAFAAALITTRAAYRELRASKRYYASLASATRQASRDVAYVVSNIWWFDQINAGVRIPATFLYAKSPSESHLILRRTAPAPLLVATSTESEFATDLQQWLAGSCYHVVAETATQRRSVTLHRLECREHNRR